MDVFRRRKKKEENLKSVTVQENLNIFRRCIVHAQYLIEFKKKRGRIHSITDGDNTSDWMYAQCSFDHYNYSISKIEKDRWRAIESLHKIHKISYIFTTINFRNHLKHFAHYTYVIVIGHGSVVFQIFKETVALLLSTQLSGIFIRSKYQFWI